MRSATRATHTLLLLALLRSAAASAQTAETPPDPAVLAEAQARYAGGAERYARGDYAGALAEFDESYRLVPSLRVLFSRGLCRHALGDLPGAAADLRRYLAEGGDAVPPDLRVQAESLLEELAPRLGRLAVETSEPAAELLLDGRLVGASPLDHDLEITAGEHILEVRKEGFLPRRLTVVVLPAERSAVAVTLEPRPALLRVDAGDVPAAVLLDGRPAGAAGETLELPPGPHRVRIEAIGFDPLERDLVLEPGAVESVAVVLVPIPPPPEPEPTEEPPGVGERYWWLWTALGAVALGGAVAAGVLLWPEPEPSADWRWRMR